MSLCPNMSDRVWTMFSYWTVQWCYIIHCPLTCRVGDSAVSEDDFLALDDDVMGVVIVNPSPSSIGILRRRMRKFSQIMSNVSTSSLNHTIPQRLTVASVAERRSSTSNIILTYMPYAPNIRIHNNIQYTHTYKHTYTCVCTHICTHAHAHTHACIHNTFKCNSHLAANSDVLH